MTMRHRRQRHASTIQGARSIAVNGMRRYDDAPRRHRSDGQWPAVSGDHSGLSGSASTRDSTTFIDAALANTQLLQRKLAGLNNADLRRRLPPAPRRGNRQQDPGRRPGGAGRPGPVRLPLRQPQPAQPEDDCVYGSGESGSLVLRAGGNLNIYGSINDGFAPPPAVRGRQRLGAAAGCATSTAATIVVPGNGVTLAEGTPFPAGSHAQLRPADQGPDGRRRHPFAGGRDLGPGRGTAGGHGIGGGRARCRGQPVVRRRYAAR